MDLLGKTILITRAADQSADLRDALLRLGARVIERPAIEVKPPEDWRPVDAAIFRLESYDWILFTSANAVELFMKRLEVHGIHSIHSASRRVSIAVVGPATAEKLREWNLSANLVPEDFRAEGLLDAFPMDLAGTRILFPRAASAREILPEELRRRGATVDVVVAYRTVRAAGLNDLGRLLTSEPIDCVVFMSPSTIRFVLEALDEDAALKLRTLPAAVIGPVTDEAAASSGLTTRIKPVQSTVADLVQAIQNHFLAK